MIKVLLVVCSVSLLFVQGEVHEDEWIDPTDMLNYDAASMTMRKSPPEPEKINDDRPVQTEMQECAPCPSQKVECPDITECQNKVSSLQREECAPCQSQKVECPDITECQNKVSSLQREIQEQKNKMMSSTAQKPGCSPVFRRYLTKLLKGVEKLGLPNEANAAVHYDAEVKLTRAAVSEIQRLLAGDDSWKTGALDEALSQILVNFKRHDYEAWVWRFEDSFGVELYTIAWVCVCVLMIVLTICTELWSRVSWFTQFKRLFAFCFFISIIWNWLYLYKVAFAAHQKKVAELLSISEKCSGLKQIDWMDSLTAWGRRTFTLQDDPCSEYYETLLVNPLFLVPPTKVIAMTFTTTFSLSH
ncbi:hypothetical protein AAFF_G00228780 [Aldrovandia affinis]|uniref:Chloride channel CLIC-like protein 1 n=1 Tax=Aldrovandia affinis TaxID=143900 RepID=A0AAD7SWI1_9TELE|nr:hypothetical protein AAFF_G00228780 [Aldrovandia affinis]